MHLKLLLTGSPWQLQLELQYWQDHPVNSGHLYIIDRVTLSTVHQNMLLIGWITTNQELRNATNQSLFYIGFTLSAVYMRMMSYWQGHPVNSGGWCLIDRVTLSAVGVNVLLTEWPRQQWLLMSYWQGHPASGGCWCLIDRVTLSAVGVDVIC